MRRPAGNTTAGRFVKLTSTLRPTERGVLGGRAGSVPGFVYLARNANQQIDTLLGRAPTPDERRLLVRAVIHWLELDKQDPAG